VVELRDPVWLYGTLVSPEDLPLVSPFTWRTKLNRENGNLYAVTSRARKTVYMHRLITKCPVGMVVDHANRDTLDNRRENLRITTVGKNGANHGEHQDSLVPYRGVSFHGKARYRARIRRDGVDVHLGTFPTPEEAAAAYDSAALAVFGPFAWINLRPASPAEEDIPF
jgi:hypothetical protein